jgi:hypothetical protein
MIIKEMVNETDLTPPADIDIFAATAASSTCGLAFRFIKQAARKFASLVA